MWCWLLGHEGRVSLCLIVSGKGVGPVISFGGSAFRQIRDFRNSDPFSSKYFSMPLWSILDPFKFLLCLGVCSLICRENLEEDRVDWNSREGAAIAAGPMGLS